MEKIVKIIMAVLLLLCLADMPYGYYQFVRFAAMMVFAWLGYNAYEEGNKNVAFIFLGLALLFQPFLKISLGREMWNIVDVVVGVGLLVSAWRK